MTDGTRHCAACEATGEDLESERAKIPSNVRAFRAELFEIWRCKRCQSLHALDEVDLAHYYAKYPFHALPEDGRLKIMYDNQLRRLRRAGLRPEHRVLDYGAGGGGFIRHLASRGFERVTGFDRYSERFNDPAVLEGRYDCIISQDVLEHVPVPSAMLDELGKLVQPGGLIALGTPNADALDIRQPDEYVHALHLPYHRHIFSKQALLAAGTRRGWEVVRYYRTQYANTAVPFLNSRFYLYYMRLCDNSLDCLMEPPRPLPLLLRLPVTLFWGFFGGLFAPRTDGMALFRR
jgi:2-polyprenyl-3-methyl-5-hydroxy-6-metoxy-1,4-benzoquinol methylase